MNDEVFKHLLNTRNRLYQQQQQWMHYVCSMLQFAADMGEERHIDLFSLGHYQTRREPWQDILNALEELKTQACHACVQTAKLESSLTLVESKLKELMDYLTSMFVHLSNIVYAPDSVKPDFAPQPLSPTLNDTTYSEAQDSIIRIVRNISQDVERGYQCLAQYAYAISETLNCNIDNLP